MERRAGPMQHSAASGGRASTRRGRRHDRRALRPFGSPDGSNANLQDLVESFVDVEPPGQIDSLGSPRYGHTARLLVGKMGVGKTVYLRRFPAAAADDEAAHADRVRRDIPTTADVVRVCQQLLAHEVDEVWERIWRRATSRAAISHILRSPDLRARPEAAELERELEDLRKLVPEFRTR